MGVAADVAEDVVHAQEALARADLLDVIEREGVEEGDAAAGADDLVVGGREQAVGQPISDDIEAKIIIKSLHPINTSCLTSN